MKQQDVKAVVTEAAAQFGAFDKEMSRLANIEDRLANRCVDIETEVKTCERLSSLGSCPYRSEAQNALNAQAAMLKDEHQVLCRYLGRTSMFAEKK